MSESIVDSYKTLGEICRHEIKIKGSRFIALGYPAESIDSAVAILDDVRKKEHAATHHCYAYTVGIESEKFKYSDDGEPSGTAGRPIYQSIAGKTLRNLIVIVVRYYGGAKLGTGGLTRAYSRTATEMLDQARIVEKLICDRLGFSVPFTLYDRAMRIINAGSYKIILQDFAEQVAIVIEIRRSKTDSFVSQLTELTGGKIEIEKNG
jgi:uncharacterized YigZ family protein